MANQWHSCQINQKAGNFSKVQLLKKHFFNIGALALVTISVFLWEDSLMADTAFQFELQMKNQHDKC